MDVGDSENVKEITVLEGPEPAGQRYLEYTCSHTLLRSEINGKSVQIWSMTEQSSMEQLPKEGIGTMTSKAQTRLSYMLLKTNRFGLRYLVRVISKVTQANTGSQRSVVICCTPEAKREELIFRTKERTS